MTAFSSSDRKQETENWNDSETELLSANDAVVCDMNEVIVPHPKKRKLNEFVDESLSNGNSCHTKSPELSRDDAQRPMNAHEEWWAAQYPFYMKLDDTQQFQMRRIWSETLSKFAIENEGQEMQIKIEENVSADDGTRHGVEPLQMYTRFSL